MKKIAPKRYSQKYFLFKSPTNNFKPPGGTKRLNSKVHLQALQYVPKEINGPFLDIGCGRGEVVFALAQEGKRSYGVDFSSEAIRLACERLKSENKSVQNLVSLKLADCTKLPFKDGIFPCLFLLDLVEHLTPRQLKLALSEGKRVLQKQGFLIIHTNNKYFEKIIKPFIAATYHGLKVFTNSKMREKLLLGPYDNLHINYLTGPELLRYLKEMDFKAKIDYVIPKRKEELKKFLPYDKSWKEFIYYHLIWPLLNSPLKRFLAPTFWLVAQKQ